MNETNGTKRLDDLFIEHRICRENQDKRWAAHEGIHRDIERNKKNEIRFYIVLTITIFINIILTVAFNYYG